MSGAQAGESEGEPFEVHPHPDTPPSSPPIAPTPPGPPMAPLQPRRTWMNPPAPVTRRGWKGRRPRLWSAPPGVTRSLKCSAPGRARPDLRGFACQGRTRVPTAAWPPTRTARTRGMSRWAWNVSEGGGHQVGVPSVQGLKVGDPGGKLGRSWGLKVGDPGGSWGSWGKLGSPFPQC